MRPIEFRAWDKRHKKMYPGPFSIIGETTMFDLLNQFSLDALNDIELMQFTGLLDKNGKKIFEGDILCWPEYEGTKKQTRWVVQWDNYKAAYESWSPRNKAEIIGNIYENPNLIKETTNE